MRRGKPEKHRKAMKRPCSFVFFFRYAPFAQTARPICFNEQPLARSFRSLDLWFSKSSTWIQDLQSLVSSISSFAFELEGSVELGWKPKTGSGVHPCFKCMSCIEQYESYELIHMGNQWQDSFSFHSNILLYSLTTSFKPILKVLQEAEVLKLLK